jgi:K+-transporting ATPase ATPase A chain
VLVAEWQFVLLFYGYERKKTETLGNFYSFSFVHSSKSFIAFVICCCNNFSDEWNSNDFEGRNTITTLEGNEQNVVVVVAAFVALKQLGTNGGILRSRFCQS